MLYAAAPGAGAAAGDASAVRHDGAHRIIAFALETWNHNTLALARARCSHNTRGALPHLRLEGGPSRGPRAGGLARREGGLHPLHDDFTLYTTPREACCLVVFMEILLGQHDFNAQHLHDLDAMSNSVLADSLERWIN